MVLTSAFVCEIAGAGEIIPSLAGYEKVEITKVEPDGVRISHKDGAAKIKFEQLPPDLQAKYGFSAEKAKAFRQKNRDQERGPGKDEPHRPGPGQG